MSTDPGSSRAKRAFDKCTKKLCEKLNELDRLVADSVVDQVTNVFVETSQPLDHLVDAATMERERGRGKERGRGRTPPHPQHLTVASPPARQASSHLHPHRPVAASGRGVQSGGSPSRQLPKEKVRRQEEGEEEEEEEEQEGMDTKQMAEVFRRHSRKLSQVAVYAARSSTDTDSEQGEEGGGERERENPLSE